MIYLWSRAPEGNEFEMPESTEHLRLVDGTLHHSSLTFSLIDNQVGLVDNAIEPRIEALYHTMVRVETILIEFFHLTIVTTLTTATPDIVGKQVLDEEPVVIVATHLEIHRCCCGIDILVGSVVCIHTTHVAVFLNVEFTLTTDSHQRHHTQQCDI